MNYGLYVSASGVLTNMYRQNVHANNLANVETAAFKPDVPTIRQRDPESIEDPAAFGLSHRLLDELGGGVLAGPQRVRFSPGPLVETGKPLDVALSDKDSFFAVEAVDPRTGQAETLYSRDGRFSLNGEGELVTQNGQRVMGPDGQAIVLPPGVSVRLGRDGRIVTEDGGVEMGRIGVVRVPETSQLTKRGGNLFAYHGATEPEALAEPRVHPGHVEGSGVDPISSLMGVTSASKAVSSNADMIRYFDRLMEQAVTTFGRVG